jgi:hypothetical protein
LTKAVCKYKEQYPKSKKYSTGILYETKTCMSAQKDWTSMEPQTNILKNENYEKTKQKNRKQMWLQTELGSIIEKVGFLKHCMHEVYSLQPALENQYQER